MGVRRRTFDSRGRAVCLYLQASSAGKGQNAIMVRKSTASPMDRTIHGPDRMCLRGQREVWLIRPIALEQRWTGKGAGSPLPVARARRCNPSSDFCCPRSTAPISARGGPSDPCSLVGLGAPIRSNCRHRARYVSSEREKGSRGCRYGPFAGKADAEWRGIAAALELGRSRDTSRYSKFWDPLLYAHTVSVVRCDSVRVGCQLGRTPSCRMGLSFWKFRPELSDSRGQ
jgi:hypothetical protein